MYIRKQYFLFFSKNYIILSLQNVNNLQTQDSKIYEYLEIIYFFQANGQGDFVKMFQSP